MGRVESNDDYRILGRCFICNKTILAKDIYSKVNSWGNRFICEHCIGDIVSNTVNEKPKINTVDDK